MKPGTTCIPKARLRQGYGGKAVTVRAFDFTGDDLLIYYLPLYYSLAVPYLKVPILSAVIHTEVVLRLFGFVVLGEKLLQTNGILLVKASALSLIWRMLANYAEPVRCPTQCI